MRPRNRQDRFYSAPLMNVKNATCRPQQVPQTEFP